MKHINKFLLLAVVAAALVSCAEDYESGHTYSKPDPVLETEYLNSFGILKTYVDRAANPIFKLGAGVNASVFLKKEVDYSLRYANFDEVTPDTALTHKVAIKNDGTTDFSTASSFIKAAKASGVAVYGHTLCWHANQNNTYLNSIIQGKAYSGTTLIADFESNAIGDSYLMTGNSSATVMADPAKQSGNVLKVGTSATPASQSFPKFNITLPAGRVLGDYKTLTLDFNGPGNGGLYGSGMRVIINSNAAVVFGSPSSFGCPDGAWGRGKIVLDLTKLNLSDADKALTNFTMAVGSGTGSGNYYIDNITMKWQYNDVKSPAQKMEIITTALNQWIDGMMKANAGYVTAWDLVSEPMSDNDSYLLKSGATEANASSYFFWQDYLGENYARKAASAARTYFAQYGGKADDLKLFVDDYGLENGSSTKCDRLIQIIAQWEADGTTKIDGIGTQMHVVYSLDATKQAANEAGILSMFNKLKATGKLIRISGLSVDIADASGAAIKTANVTPEQQKAMAAYYYYIVQKYMEIIPSAQRYGITLSNPTDVGDKAYGLWTSTYNRKYTYIGFLQGLAGQPLNIAK
ncbi:MAG: hypothetical protein BGN96_12625 [Bacteroidales bacterium 45-6]|nr:MAG: hypothetical protein BGN96_12625 [Bacteroidales bacterium 45-6]